MSARAWRIVVTGMEGQLALALAERARLRGVDLVRLGRPALDLTRPETIRPALVAARPDLVVNAAAYTAVDRAEAEPEIAAQVNDFAAGEIAAASRALGGPVIQISTDYVYDGAGDQPCREDDAVGPLGVYGRTKLAGERAVAAAQPDHVILRTAWIYSPFGRNFVRTMLDLAATRQEVAVVADQRGSPTSALDLADAVLAVADRLLGNPDDGELRGVVHAAGSGETSWAGLAEAVFALSGSVGGPAARVRPISTGEYPTAARRPANSRLDCTRLARQFGVTLPHWRDSLPACVERLLAERLS